MPVPVSYFQCPRCRTLQQISPAMTGQPLICPVCRTTFVVPAANPAANAAMPTYPGSPASPWPPSSPHAQGPQFSTPLAHATSQNAENQEADPVAMPHTARRGLALELIFLLTFLALLATAIVVVYMVVAKKKLGGRGDELAEVDEEVLDVDVGPLIEEKPYWSDARRFTLRKNDVKTKVREVTYGPVRTRDGTRHVVEDDTKKFLVVHVTLRNTSAKPRDYRSWYGSLFRVDGRQRSAELLDDQGRTYSLQKFIGATGVEGHVPDAILHYSEQTRDAIVFAIPNDLDRSEIAGFHLELPAQAYGGEGVLRFEIPVDMIQGW